MFYCEICEEYYAEADLRWVKAEGSQPFAACVSCAKEVLREGGVLAEIADCGCCPKA
jgi:hypothetical protein